MGELALIIVPDEDEPQAAELMVDGYLGDRPYRFLLDSGAARSSVAFDEYTSRLETTGESRSSGLFAGKSDDLIRVPLLKLGPVSKKDIVINRVQKGADGRRNLIGMDMMVDFSWHFLIEEERVLINSPIDAEAGSFQPLRFDSKGHPYLEIAFRGDPADAVWDSGAGVTVVDLAFIEQHRIHFEEAGKSTGTDSTGTSMETPMFVMQGAYLGGVEFPPHRVAGVDLSGVNATIEIPMDLILGYTTLRLADWFLDFPAGKWALTRAPEFP